MQTVCMALRAVCCDDVCVVFAAECVHMKTFARWLYMKMYRAELIEVARRVRYLSAFQNGMIKCASADEICSALERLDLLT